MSQKIDVEKIGLLIAGDSQFIKDNPIESMRKVLAEGFKTIIPSLENLFDVPATIKNIFQVKMVFLEHLIEGDIIKKACSTIPAEELGLLWDDHDEATQAHIESLKACRDMAKKLVDDPDSVLASYNTDAKTVLASLGFSSDDLTRTIKYLMGIKPYTVLRFAN